MNVVTLGTGDLLPMLFRRSAMFGMDTLHVSPFLSGSVSDFGKAFRTPLTRQSARGMSSDLRIDMSGEERVFSPKSTLAFAPLHAVRGFSYSLNPTECVRLCADAFASDVEDCFDLLESPAPAMLLMLVPPDTPARVVYSRVASPLLAVNPRAKRAFYAMSQSEYGGMVRRSHGFYTVPFPMTPPGERGISSAVPYVTQAADHFAGL